jgi:hypothetical protein
MWTSEAGCEKPKIILIIRGRCSPGVNSTQMHLHDHLVPLAFQRLCNGLRSAGIIHDRVHQIYAVFHAIADDVFDLLRCGFVQASCANADGADFSTVMRQVSIFNV